MIDINSIVDLGGLLISKIKQVGMCILKTKSKTKP